MNANESCDCPRVYSILWMKRLKPKLMPNEKDFSIFVFFSLLFLRKVTVGGRKIQIIIKEWRKLAKIMSLSK